MNDYSKIIPLREQTLANDFVFAAVMREGDVCKLFLEELLGFSIAELQFIEAQKVIDDAYDSHGIRLDILAKDTNGNAYNIEMQKAKDPALAKRARYYQSAIDRHMLAEGTPYEQLPRCIVIFICMFDLFGAGHAVYRVHSRIDGLPEYPYDDGRTTYFLNSMYRMANTDDAVLEFLDCVNGKELDHDTSLARITVDTLKKVRSDKEQEEMYMTLSMKLQDSYNEGHAAGRAAGHAEGRAEGNTQGRIRERLDTIRMLMQNGMSTAQIARMYQMTEQQLLTFMKEHEALAETE